MENKPQTNKEGVPNSVKKSFKKSVLKMKFFEGQNYADMEN